jgi:uncharacterized protein (TIGR03067 family)
MIKHLIVLFLVATTSTALCADPKPPKNPLNGLWKLASGVKAGEKMPEDVQKSIFLMLRNGKYVATVGKQTDQGTYTVDKTKTPATITLVGTSGPNVGKTMLAIYELDKNSLKVCYDLSGKAFPTAFESKPGTQSFLANYERETRGRAKLIQ